MKIESIKTIYFSPCGVTKTVAEFMGKTFSKLLNVKNENISYTLPLERNKFLERSCFKKNELVIWATPVYAGRIPNKTLDFVKEALKGDGNITIPVVVYGNRNFDNALAELTGIMKDNGMKPIAGAAIVSAHMFSNSIATGRPNATDFEEIKEFCSYVANCIKTNHELNYVITAPGNEHPDKYYTPLKEDGTPANFLKAKPKLREELCVSCGICRDVCPMGSIVFENGDINSDLTTPYPNFVGVCIKCQACARNCPADAVYFDDEEFLSHVRMLEKNYSKPQENCFIC